LGRGCYARDGHFDEVVALMKRGDGMKFSLRLYEET
jgi:hypothetical protein